MTIEDDIRALEEKAKWLIAESARLRQREQELVKEIEETSVSTWAKHSEARTGFKLNPACNSS